MKQSRKSLGAVNVDETLDHADVQTRRLVQEWDLARAAESCIGMYSKALLIASLAGAADEAFFSEKATPRRRKLWRDIKWRRQDIGGRTMSCLKRKSAM